MRSSRATFVVLLALLGVGLAAGITYAASRLVSEPIGLAAEPHDLSSSLTAPAPTAAATPTTATPATATPTRTTPPPTATSPPPSAAVAPPASSAFDGHDYDGDDD